MLKSRLFWIFLAFLVVLNIWFDYYHPLGITFDIIAVAVLALVGLKFWKTPRLK